MRYNKLKHPVHHTGKPGEHLAQTFRDIVVRLGLIPVMDVLITERLLELKELYPTKRHSRGPIDKEIMSNSMTFDSFLNILVNHLKLDIDNITIDVNFNGNVITQKVYPNKKEVNHESMDKKAIQDK